MYSLYETTNLINSKCYVGVHDEDRIMSQPYLGSGVALQKAIKKYGRQNFIREIIIELNDIDAIYKLEALVVDKEFINKANVYNMKVGGYGGSLAGPEHPARRHVYTDEQIETRRRNRLGFKVSDETRAKLSKASTGIKQSTETKEKRKKTQTGKKLGPYKEHTCNVCGKVGRGGNMKRYHFDNCKHK